MVSPSASRDLCSHCGHHLPDSWPHCPRCGADRCSRWAVRKRIARGVRDKVLRELRWWRSSFPDSVGAAAAAAADVGADGTSTMRGAATTARVLLEQPTTDE